MKRRNRRRSIFSDISLLAFFCFSFLVLCNLSAPVGQTATGEMDVISAAYKSTDAGMTWVPVSNGLTCYHVGPLAIDHNSPNTIYAGTDRGVFKTTDGGGQWVQINGLITLFNVNALAIDPSEPSIVYAGGFAFGGSAILKSVDAGLTWKAISGGLTISNIFSVAIDPGHPSTVYAGDEFQIFKSTDGGNTWRSILSLPALGDVVYPMGLQLCPSNPAILYALGSDRLYKTVDGGSNWTNIIERFRSSFPSEPAGGIAADPSDSAVVYVTGAYGTFYKTTDGGQTWTALPRNTPPLGGLKIDPAAPSTLYAKSFQSLLKSTDGGNTWAVTGLTSVNSTDLAFDPANSSVIYAGALGDLRPLDTPWIWSFFLDSKRLTIRGQFFDDGAEILLDGEAQPTKNDPSEPNSLLIGKKAGKKIRKNPDTRIQVRNSNGKLSQQVTIWPPIN